MFPKLRFFLPPYQGILRSRYDWNVGASDEFEHAQSVRHFRLQPLISGHDSDPQNFRLWDWIRMRMAC